MGFLDKFRKKKDENATVESKGQDAQGQQPQRRIKKYTSEGKPVYE